MWKLNFADDSARGKYVIISESSVCDKQFLPMTQSSLKQQNNEYQPKTLQNPRRWDLYLYSPSLWRGHSGSPRWENHEWNILKN
jgi:hypothetical protein